MAEAKKRNLKLTKTSWIVLLTSVLILALASVGYLRYEQQNEQTMLSDELEVAQLRLSKMELRELKLQTEETSANLEVAIAELDTKIAALQVPIASIDLTDNLFEYAESCNITIISLNSSRISPAKIGSVDCLSTTVALQVTGKIGNLISYVKKINDGQTTGVVRSTIINLETKSVYPIADIQFCVYSLEESQ